MFILEKNFNILHTVISFIRRCIIKDFTEITYKLYVKMSILFMKINIYFKQRRRNVTIFAGGNYKLSEYVYKDEGKSMRPQLSEFSVF